MYDIVLLHPGGQNMKGLQGPFFPIGWLGITSYIKKQGYKASIVNFFLERHLDPEIKIESLLKKYPSFVYGIDLHWFIHSFEAIALAKQVKKCDPKSKIVLGGLTASCFAEHILRDFAFVDGIIRGDGELPLLRYIEKIKTGNEFCSVPNLSFRQQSKIYHNPIKYVASNQDLDELEFLDFSCVVNYEHMFYLNNADYTINAPNSEDFQRYFLCEKRNIFSNWPVYTGRGCNYDCSFCGGSKTAFRLSNNRKCLALRSPERIADDVIKLSNEMGIESIYFPHSPLTTNKVFNQAILNNIRKYTHKLKSGFFFEDVPFIIDIDVLEEYLEIFNPYNSVIRVYVADCDEDVRKKNNFNFSWDKVLQLHEFCKDLPVLLQVAVLVGLPGQNRNTSKRLVKELKKLQEFHYFPLIYTAEMHPASPLHKKPIPFGIYQKTATFHDFYTYLSKQTNKRMFLGYDVNTDCPAKEQMQIIKEGLHYNTKVIYLNSKNNDVINGKDRKLRNGSLLIHKLRSRTNRYVGMIKEAHAVGAKNILLYIENNINSLEIQVLLSLCHYLKLNVTVCVGINALVEFRIQRRTRNNSNIKLDLVIYGKQTSKEVGKKTADVLTQIKNGLECIFKLGQVIRWHVLISENDDEWLSLLFFLKSLGMSKLGVVIDDREISQPIDLKHIHQRLSAKLRWFGPNVSIINFSKMIT